MSLASAAHHRRQAGDSGLVPLAALIKEEARTERRGAGSRICAREEDGGAGAAWDGAERRRPLLRYGCAAQSKKGEDFFLLRTDCARPSTSSSSTSSSPPPTFAVFAVLDGHNGNAAAIYTRDNLLNHVLSAMPRGLSKEEWLHALPRALVAGFVKTDKEFQTKGQTSGTTATFVIIDGWTITVASVGDSRWIGVGLFLCLQWITD